MLNIVIPMAGRGSRFVKAGYKAPKPLLDIHGRHMIEVVTENIMPDCVHRFIYLCLEEHLVKYPLKECLCRISPECIIVPVREVTQGAACTVLLAEPYIDNTDQLMIANSDQYVDININEYLRCAADYDGLIMTMHADDPKWSYIQYDGRHLVTLVREKEVISDEATVGIYNFKRGQDFVKYAHEMINNEERVNGEFYVAPVYNRYIKNGGKISFFNVGKEDDGMYGLGIPEDLEKFIPKYLQFQRKNKGGLTQ